MLVRSASITTSAAVIPNLLDAGGSSQSPLLWSLLPCQRNMVPALGVFLGHRFLVAEMDQHRAQGSPGEHAARVVSGDGPATIRADIHRVHGENERGRLLDASLCDVLAAD